eukprot:3212015-Prymnesium_polylepis.1
MRCLHQGRPVCTSSWGTLRYPRCQFASLSRSGRSLLAGDLRHPLLCADFHAHLLLLRSQAVEKTTQRHKLIAMGDRNCRALQFSHDVLKRRLDDLLALVVERRCGFVQQQERGLLDDGSRDCHPLLLPTRKLAPALAHLRTVTIGQVIDDKVVSVGHPRCLFDLILRRAVLPVRNVLRDRAHKKCWLLPDETNLLAEPTQVEQLQIGAVQTDFALHWVVETLQQLDDGRLARPTRAAECTRLPRTDAEAVAVADEVCWC